MWIQDVLRAEGADLTSDNSQLLINAAKKLDEARYAQDEQLKQVIQGKQENIEKSIRSAQGKQIAKEEQSELVSQTPTTREGYGENYAANRVDPETTADRQMMEALTPKSAAEQKEYIDLIKKSKGRITIEDLVYQDAKGKWKLRKINKALRNKAEGKQPKSNK